MAAHRDWTFRFPQSLIEDVQDAAASEGMAASSFAVQAALPGRKWLLALEHPGAAAEMEASPALPGPGWGRPMGPRWPAPASAVQPAPP